MHNGLGEVGLAVEHGAGIVKSLDNVTAHDIDVIQTRQCSCTARMSLEGVRVLEADGKALVSAMTLRLGHTMKWAHGLAMRGKVGVGFLGALDGLIPEDLRELRSAEAVRIRTQVVIWCAMHARLRYAVVTATDETTPLARASLSCTSARRLGLAVHSSRPCQGWSA